MFNKMIRQGSVILIFIFISINAFSQSEYINKFYIRNYKQSALIILKENSNISSFSYSDYGHLLIEKNTKSTNSNYLYQGQERDEDLGIYYFPNRIYNTKSKRFLQPDPLSQYHNPYLFVGANPINIVDFDGNAGKPLILYQESHFFDSKIPDEVSGLKAQVPDAHYGTT